MVARNPNQTARNKYVESLKVERRKLQPDVFKELKYYDGGRYCNELSLNALIGSKIDDYIDVRNDIIKTPEEFASKWVKGLKEKAGISEKTHTDPRHIRMLDLLKDKDRKPNFRKYVMLFLKSSFLKHYESHSKTKPKVEESEYWFGDNSDEYGLLVTPRFVNGAWENDKSEIKHFKKPYWTISHVMEVGLCILNKDKIHKFSQIDDYLNFFERSVKMTKSKYQLYVAEKYIEFVKSSSDPDSIPLLIPELRYDPYKNKHEHRLDYLVINPWDMSKIGFEFSPWSSHGKLSGAGRSMKDYDEDAKANFEKEMRKHKKYWRKHGILYVTYTSEDLENLEDIWLEIKSYLTITRQSDQLELHLINELLS